MQPTIRHSLLIWAKTTMYIHNTSPYVLVCYTVLTILCTHLVIPISYYHWQMVNNSLIYTYYNLSILMSYILLYSQRMIKSHQLTSVCRQKLVTWNLLHCFELSWMLSHNLMKIHCSWEISACATFVAIQRLPDYPLSPLSHWWLALQFLIINPIVRPYVAHILVMAVDNGGQQCLFQV